uniref:Clathrin light chain n=1 Tax=Trypanosoma congolense (strain IL3000) TaxID=1068625 RepID=G0UYL4_TRYCI|nr:unnamed protein product [Trypanosoma congolense IL3000]
MDFFNEDQPQQPPIEGDTTGAQVAAPLASGEANEVFAAPNVAAAPATTAAPAEPMNQDASTPACVSAKKNVDARTADIDTKSHEKEKQLVDAAQAYLKELNKERDNKIKETKEKHIRDQEVSNKKEPCRDAASVWASMRTLVDFTKANKYSKNTERMRSILSNLAQVKSS